MLGRVWVEGGRRNGFAAALSCLWSFWRTRSVRLASEPDDLVFQALLARGLRPAHRCVEIGCGELRLAAQLIRYLGDRGYVGVDAAGPPAIGLEPALAAKCPFLGQIEPSLVLALAADPPDRVVCAHDLAHTSSDALESLMQLMCRLIGPHTTGWFVLGGGDCATAQDALLARFQTLRPDLHYHATQLAGAELQAGYAILTVCGRQVPSPAAEAPAVSSLDAYRARRANGRQ